MLSGPKVYCRCPVRHATLWRPRSAEAPYTIGSPLGPPLGFQVFRHATDMTSPAPGNRMVHLYCTVCLLYVFYYRIDGIHSVIKAQKSCHADRITSNRYKMPNFVHATEAQNLTYTQVYVDRIHICT